MKRVLSFMFFVGYGLVGFTQAPIPPPINFDSVDDPQVFCSFPQEVELTCVGYAYAAGTSGTDTVWVNFNFGDGQDTTIISQWSWPGTPQFSAVVDHTYASPGNYPVEYLAWVTPGTSTYSVDWLIHNQVLIGDTCGNIEGTVYIDGNSNCIHDSVETVLPNAHVSLLIDGEHVISDFTDSNGHYHFNVPAVADYEIELNTDGFTDLCSGNVLSVSTIPSSDNDFGVVCNTDQFDLDGAMSGWAFRPGMIGTLAPHVWNNGCLPTNGTLKILLDPITTFVSAVPDSSISWSGDTAVFEFEELAAYDWFSEGFMMRLMVDSTAILDSLVCFEMWICPEFGDADPSNNYVQECFPVVNSYDPNDKQVTPAGIGENGAILPNQTMTYRLRFQNTGTAEAFNVFIMDTIDTDLDMTTFEVLSASHQMDVYFPDERVVKFNFPNINLPDSTTNEPESHGYVLYRIAQNPNLPPGTVIENTGHIYFDINPPVVTNTTINTIDLFVDVEPVNELESVQFYPNPANETVIVQTEVVCSVLSILDMSGRQVYGQILATGNNSIDISQLNNGSYILRVDANGRVAVSKLMKMGR